MDVEMAIRAASPQKSLKRATVAFYPSRSASASDRLLAAQLVGSIVLRGEDGVSDALRLYADGWAGQLRIDPSNHEQPHSLASTPNLFGEDPWLVDQHRAQVVEVLSPGRYVPGCSHAALLGAIATEGSWLAAAGGGRLSMVLDWKWLTIGLSSLLAELSALDVPLALALADPNDPLAHPGAVRGLASLVATVPDLILLRSDIGALGAIAHGAAMAAIGTSTSVRHVVPPGKSAGGGRTGFPSVFWPELMDWKLADGIGRLPARLRPRCHLACCNGGTLDEFAGLRTPAEARVHNLHALAHVTSQLLDVSPPHRATAFKQACAAAVSLAGLIETRGKQPFPPRPQVVAWAEL